MKFEMPKRFDLILILVFIVIVLIRPEGLVEFVSKKEVLIVLNIGVAGFLIYQLYYLVSNRATVEKLWMKIGFTVGILIVPAMFLTGNLVFETQTLLLYLIILGFFYMTVL